ncbi:MAG: hypothetical protein CM15mP58_12450 [Burkholderiaceae bacterium]|nr:MAG: hypothetical protein CM15mP58_12450 [Burkholderiaceae bacterium]
MLINYLKNFLVIKAIMSDFVIGYLVGYKVTHKSVHPLPICQDNTEVGCIVGWNTIIQSGFKIFNDKDLVCINPLSWKEDEVLFPGNTIWEVWVFQDGLDKQF